MTKRLEFPDIATARRNAERRLEKAEENLLRLRDIVSELEGRIEPLRIQSEKAQQFLEYSEEKRTLEIGLWLETLNRSGTVLREQADKISVAQGQYDGNRRSPCGFRRRNGGLLPENERLLVAN